MTKILSFLLALTVLFSLSALAKEMKLPDEDFAIASITIPNSWKPEAIERGFEAQSPDNAIYLSAVAVGSEKGMNAEIEDTFKFLKEHKVKLNESSKKEQKFTVNGLEAQELVYDGKDEDGPATISLAFVPIKSKVIVFTYWASKEDEAKHEKEISKILNSLKPLGEFATPAPAKEVKVEVAIAVDADTRPATVFSKDVPKLYAFFKSKGTAKGDELKSVWIAEDVGKAAPKNYKIDEATLKADQDNFFGAFSLSRPNDGWPVGKYRVEISIGDQRVASSAFEIQ